MRERYLSIRFGSIGKMIRRNTCKEDGCEYPVFAKKLCKYHQNLRTDKKPTQKKRSTIKAKIKPSGERTIFDLIWNTRDRISFVSGKSLQQYEGTDFYPNLFAHVLSKAQNRYPKFKLYDRNIVLLTPDEHYLLDFGTEEQREKYAEEHNCSWQPLYDLRDELKKNYV